MPKLRFKEFEGDGEWVERPLGSLVEIKSGMSPSSYSLDSKGTFPYLKVEDLNNCDKYQVKSREYSNSSKNIVPVYSLIFPKRGAAIALNKIRINKTDILMDSNLMAITPNDDIYIEFLYYLISKKGLNHIADTSTIPQINNKHIEPLIVNVPEKSEQQKIANFLSSIDDEIAVQAQKIEGLKEHKKGLMQGLFPAS